MTTPYVETTAKLRAIEVYQDFEYDEDSFGSPLPVFWTKGHGHEAGEFVRAVVEFCLNEDRDIPAISLEDRPAEMWQRNREVSGGGVEYLRRVGDKPGYDGMTGPVDWFPITILDMYEQRRGAHKCAVDGCREPWSSGNPARVVVSATVGDEHELGGTPSETVYLWLCRKHRKIYPEPSYRVFMVPVGATIMLPAPAQR